MNIPCPVRVNCPGAGNLEYDSPLSNFSSEAPDQDFVVLYNFGWDLNLPNLGWTWKDISVPGECDALTSDQAILCSASQQISNTVNLGNWRDQNGNAVQLYGNAAQSCPYTCPDGTLFVWTVAAGQVLALSQSKADSIARSLACKFALSRHICLSNISDTCVGLSYSQAIGVMGGEAPYTYSLTAGSLPPGVTFSQISPTVALLSGTPTSPGTYVFTVTVTDKQGNFMSKEYTLGVLGISNVDLLPAGVDGAAYSFQLQGAGGTPPYVFAVAMGTLPAGLTLSSSGLISGTPTGTGASAFTLEITDSST